MKKLDEIGKWLASWMWPSDGWLDNTTKMGVLLAGAYLGAIVIWMVVFGHN